MSGETAGGEVDGELIKGECQLEGTGTGLFSSPWHPENITVSHQVCPLQPQ